MIINGVLILYYWRFIIVSLRVNFFVVFFHLYTIIIIILINFYFVSWSVFHSTLWPIWDAFLFWLQLWSPFLYLTFWNGMSMLITMFFDNKFVNHNICTKMMLYKCQCLQSLAFKTWRQDHCDTTKLNPKEYVLWAESITHITTYSCRHPHFLCEITQWPPHHITLMNWECKNYLGKPTTNMSLNPSSFLQKDSSKHE